MVQLPMLPLEFSGGPGLTPNLERRRINLAGGAASYSFHGNGWAVVAEGGMTLDEKKDGRMNYQRLTVEFYPSGRLSVDFGILSRFTQLQDCHNENVTCLVEGKVRTTLRELTAIVGIGSVFFHARQ